MSVALFVLAIVFLATLAAGIAMFAFSENGYDAPDWVAGPTVCIALLSGVALAVLAIVNFGVSA